MQSSPSFSDKPPTPAATAWSQRTLTLSVLAFLALLYVPLAGNYGLWDPWETHYGEVARQMVARNDWISLWWPGSPQDPASGVFWSKPVLTFWLMAMSLRLFGLGHGDPGHFSEMAVGWRAEWALRVPFLLLGIAGIWATYHLVLRLASRRAAIWSALVLGTSAQWALITRQAMTDMPFVVPMTVAVVFAGLALIPLPKRAEAGPDGGAGDDTVDPMLTELPRRSRKLGPLTLSWPHARAFYGFLILYALCVVPQLVVDLVQLDSFGTTLFGKTYRISGLALGLPFALLFGVSLYWSAQARTRRSIYLWVAYIMGALATLAKGPAGIAMPILSVLVFLLVTGRLDEIWGGARNSKQEKESEKDEEQKRAMPGLLRQIIDAEDGLELIRGTVVFACVGAPWYLAMIARHGMPFWMELIGDNYVHRAQGRHGDRGTFEYYLRQLGAGLFPWSGVVAASFMQLGRWLRAGDPRLAARRQLVALALSWFVVDFAVVSLVNTKFHHYILPALPAVAVLAGVLLDELGELSAGGRTARAALLLIGVPITFLSGRDLANFPARIGWLFNYDYVNVPNTGRPWPLTTIYGERYEYGLPLYCFALAATVATLLLALPPRESKPQAARPPLLSLLPGAILFLILLALGIAVGPDEQRVAAFSISKLPLDSVLPRDLRWVFLVPAALSGLWLLVLVLRQQRMLRISTAAMALCAVLFTTFVLDRFMIDISPHWSQKHVFATYYRLRKGPEEPVVAWMMYWRGENLYTSNQIYDHRIDAAEKTVFLGDKNVEKLQAYISSHRGRRVFFLIERHRLEALRSMLPEGAKQSLEVVDDSNNKVYLARAQL